MASKFGTWWQRMRHHPFAVISILGLLMAFLAVALTVHWLGWGWTGFAPYFSPPGTQYNDVPRGRTLWDWLGLLIIPFMLVVGGYWLNLLQRTRDERATEERNKRETEIAADKQKEAVLDAYLDHMSELFLEKKLRTSVEGDEVRLAARARTIMAFRRIDGIRKALVIRGLHDQGLIDKNTCIIRLNGAPLQGVPLHKASLSGAGLSKADLFGADLFGADLSGADLSGANLFSADLRQTHLSGANLSGADLRQVHLSGANLSNADLKGARLSEADLKDAIGVTVEELQKQAASLTGATLPDGKIHS